MRSAIGETLLHEGGGRSRTLSDLALCQGPSGSCGGDEGRSKRTVRRVQQPPLALRPGRPWKHPAFVIPGEGLADGMAAGGGEKDSGRTPVFLGPKSGWRMGWPWRWGQLCCGGGSRMGCKGGPCKSPEF